MPRHTSDQSSQPVWVKSGIFFLKMLHPINVKTHWLRIIRISSLVSPKLPERRYIPVQFWESDREPALSAQLNPLEAPYEM